MNEAIRFLAEYGYWLLTGAILGRQACLPIPADLVLVAAGALARWERLSPAGIVGLCVLVFLCADLVWYEAGRRLGARLLDFVCGLTRDSASCAHKVVSTFDEHGVKILLVSKFLPGIDAVAVPLAGQAHVSLTRFLVYDALGSAFWTGTYAGLGYVFADQLARVAVHIAQVGAFLALVVAGGLAFCILRKVARWIRFACHAPRRWTGSVARSWLSVTSDVEGMEPANMAPAAECSVSTTAGSFGARPRFKPAQQKRKTSGHTYQRAS